MIYLIQKKEKISDNPRPNDNLLYEELDFTVRLGKI